MVYGIENRWVQITNSKIQSFNSHRILTVINKFQEVHAMISIVKNIIDLNKRYAIFLLI